MSETGGVGAGPAVSFEVEDARVVDLAAVPTLGFRVRIGCVDGRPIRALALDVELRIAADRRHYEPEERARLADLFGAPEQWGRSLRSLPWIRTALHVGRFDGATTVEVRVPCTYDLEVKASKYFQGLASGTVPLEFLFAGNVYYGGVDGRLRVTRIAWGRTASYRLPIRMWRAVMDRYFPDGAWIRVDRDLLDRLNRYRIERTLPTCDAALDELLAATEEEVR
ncbi:MAG: DUF6084 family protein [Gemmatimonadota bacterium]